MAHRRGWVEGDWAGELQPEVLLDGVQFPETVSNLFVAVDVF